MADYSRTDKLLHYLALNSETVRAISFDLERSLARVATDEVTNIPHIFVAGLARAGTTVLLRSLFERGEFAALSYRDMPFVLSPGLWRKVTGGHQIEGTLSERAHQDGIQVGFDSVEAFEEVFWLTFAKTRYVRDTYLTAHTVSKALRDQFRAYVAIVIAASGDPSLRYLSKNNNNLLRLAGLRSAFPKCHIIVPFRDPFQHARSLLRQHQLFSESQTKDPFEKRYMSWLGHHEFGLDYRPFAFSDEPPKLHNPDPLTVAHWIESWDRIYRGVLATAPGDALFWNYDAFCADPQRLMSALLDHIGVSGENGSDATMEIRAPRPYDGDGDVSQEIMTAASETYGELKARSIF